jgi:hypothetical protein
MNFPDIDPVRLHCVVPLRKSKRNVVDGPSAEEITNLSEDTLKRRYPHLIRDLSDRRRGMQLGDALAIAAGKAAATLGPDHRARAPRADQGMKVFAGRTAAPPGAQSGGKIEK